MKTTFHLAWHKPGAPLSRAFKLPGALESFSEYLKRLGRDCSAEGGLPQGGRIWLLDRGPSSKILSSEDLAGRLEAEKGRGGGRLSILIGPADGFTEAEINAFKPVLRWSFGPLTLPHELAAITAAEQYYRAVCILGGHPYHGGH